VKKYFVIRSINNSDESLCVDLFQRKDNSFGFEEFRRDKENNEGWYKIGVYGNRVFLTEEEAYKNARKNIVWLNNND
tara:strand:- start:185 stop:415 length:231 start_codon:yes stop_codon:yes gene_type:complete